MTKINELTVCETLDGLKSKKFSATEVFSSYASEMEKRRNLNAYVLETLELAKDQAKVSDTNYANGTNRELEGIPLGIKDLFCTKGIRTTSCSKILENFVPPYESTVTDKLFKSGAVCLGKLNMDEFAMGSSNKTSCFGPAINPWKEELKLTPGGSSGGSASAVAANMCAAATGSDTGGSIRMPSAYCGVTGIKPTYGRCSKYGMIAYASSLDQAGIIGKDVKDTALLLKLISGYDDKDANSCNLAVPDFVSSVGQSVKGLKIGIPREYRPCHLNSDICKNWDKAGKILESLGAEIVEVHMPHTEYALPAYYTIAMSEVSSNLAKFDGIRYGLRVDGETLDDIYINSRTEGFGDEVKRRIMLGTYLLSAGHYDAYYLRAQKIRQLVRNDFDNVFKKCDVLLTPTTVTPAFSLEAAEVDSNPVDMYLNDIFTVPINLAGVPSMSLPIGLTSDGLPLGIQLIAKPFDEESIFKAAYAIETEAGFVRK